MKKCPYCGFENKDEATFCSECGKPLGIEGAIQKPSEDSTNQAVSPNPPKKMGFFAYLGYTILFLVPGIGLVCGLILGFFRKKANPQLKKYARIWFFIQLIVLILLILGGILYVGFFVWFFRALFEGLEQSS